MQPKNELQLTRSDRIRYQLIEILYKNDAQMTLADLVGESSYFWVEVQEVVLDNPDCFRTDTTRNGDLRVALSWLNPVAIKAAKSRTKRRDRKKALASIAPNPQRTKC